MIKPTRLTDGFDASHFHPKILIFKGRYRAFIFYPLFKLSGSVLVPLLKCSELKLGSICSLYPR